jgi:hypothetical protein
MAAFLVSAGYDDPWVRSDCRRLALRAEREAFRRAAEELERRKRLEGK